MRTRGQSHAYELLEQTPIYNLQTLRCPPEGLGHVGIASWRLLCPSIAALQRLVPAHDQVDVLPRRQSIQRKMDQDVVKRLIWLGEFSDLLHAGEEGGRRSIRVVGRRGR